MSCRSASDDDYHEQEYFSYDPSVDKISLVQKKVDETKKVMVENIGTCRSKS